MVNVVQGEKLLNKPLNIKNLGNFAPLKTVVQDIEGSQNLNDL